MRARDAADQEWFGPTKKARVAQAIEAARAAGGFAALLAGMGSSKSVAPADYADALLAQPEDARREAEAAAERIREGAPEIRLALMLECFPHRADWAAELARQRVAGARLTPYRDVLLSTLADGALLLEIVRLDGSSACVVDWARTAGEASVPVLAELLDLARYPNEEKSVARALACVGTKEAAATFAKHLRRQNVRPFATAFFAQFPHLAEEALGPLAAKKTQVAGVAKTILAGLSRARPAQVPPEEGAESSMDEAPEALRAPPWERKPKKRARRTVAHLEVPREPSRLHWRADARARWLASHFAHVTTWDEDEIRTFQSKVAGKETAYLSANLPKEIALPLFDAPPAHVDMWRETPVAFLAKWGEEALGGFLTAFETRNVECPATVLLQVESPRVAAALAKELARGRDMALQWLERFPEAGARGLVPIAVGAGPTRDGAERGLRHLARAGHAELVRRIAAALGDDARASVEEILGSEDPADVIKKPPKMPPAYRPEQLRAPQLRDGRALPREAVVRLDQLLRASALEWPHPAIAEVRAACDARSLAEHAWDLARAWDVDGGKDAQRWMRHAVAHLGDDEVVRRLTPALKGEGIAPMLGHIATDAALMELVTIHARVSQTAKKWPKYAWGVDRAIELIAAKRGLDEAEIEDRFVPVRALGDDGAVSLDLGARRWRVGFDASLSRVLVDEKGARAVGLPRTAKTGDDADKLAAAAATLADLDEDVGAIAARRVAAIERAMICGRAWELAAWRAAWADHPLLRHMARAVVWEARDDGGRALATFRLAEDGSLADVRDEAIALPDRATRVGVAHPATLTEGERAAWRELFVSYEILPPLDQLGRTPPAPGETYVRAPIAYDEATGRPLLAFGWLQPLKALFALPTCGGFATLQLAHTGAVEARAAWYEGGVRRPPAEAPEIARWELVRALEIASGAR